MAPFGQLGDVASIPSWTLGSALPTLLICVDSSTKVEAKRCLKASRVV
jgi:hypothetical protein